MKYYQFRYDDCRFILGIDAEPDKVKKALDEYKEVTPTCEYNMPEFIEYLKVIKNLKTTEPPKPHIEEEIYF